MISERHRCYIKILEVILPCVRNVECSCPELEEELHALHYEIELVHNIPYLLLQEGYSAHDVRWLRSQADPYLGNSSDGPFYDQVTDSIKRIEQSLPPDLKQKLQDIRK